MAELTLGQKRVRVSFNPSANSKVEEAKKVFADQIDALEEMRKESTVSNPEHGEIMRSISVAQSLCEDACEKVVKAITAFF